MSITVNRRSFFCYGVGCVTAGALLSGGASAASNTAVLSAKIEAHDGRPVANRKIAVSGRDGLDYHETDSDGILEAEVASDQRYKLGLYKSGSGQLHAPELNGVPHIEGLGSHYVGSSSTDVGTLEVPEGYQVDILVLGAGGNPVENADFDFRDGSGFGGSAYLLGVNQDGYGVIRNADFTGIEANGQTKFTVTISGEGGKADKQYSDSFDVSEPSTIRVKEGEGMSIHSGVGGKTGQTPTPTPTATPSPTATSTATPTQTSKPTSTPVTTTSIPKSSKAGTQTAVEPTDTPAPVKRGFLQNGKDAEDIAFLSDPLFMTVGGFALSVAGILHQLLRGN